MMDYCVPPPFFSPFYMVGLSILKSLYPLSPSRPVRQISLLVRSISSFPYWMSKFLEIHSTYAWFTLGSKLFCAYCIAHDLLFIDVFLFSSPPPSPYMYVLWPSFLSRSRFLILNWIHDRRWHPHSRPPNSFMFFFLPPGTAKGGVYLFSGGSHPTRFSSPFFIPGSGLHWLSMCIFYAAVLALFCYVHTCIT